MEPTSPDLNSSPPHRQGKPALDPKLCPRLPVKKKENRNTRTVSQAELMLWCSTARAPRCVHDWTRLPALDREGGGGREGNGGGEWGRGMVGGSEGAGDFDGLLFVPWRTICYHKA